jgi:AcrR family transcriptional regulator
LSIRKIADAIEYSAPVIYDHFANKEAIMLEFTRQGFQLLNDELVKAKKRFPNPEQQIEAMAYNYWDFSFKNKEYYQLMYGLGMPTCETVKQIPELASFTELIVSPIKELIAESKHPEANPYMKLQTFWSMLHGLISINMMSQQESKEEMNNLVLRDFIKTFVAGIKG